MVAKMGGEAARVAKDNIEKNLGKSVISKNNTLNYEYKDDKKVQNLPKQNK